MALIRCPECKKRFSSLASACPGCGAPIAVAHAADRDQRTQQGAFIVIAIIVFIAAVSLGKREPPNTSSEPVLAAASSADQPTIVADTLASPAVATPPEPQKDEATKYVEQLDRELASIPGIKAANYTASIDSIKIGLVVIGAWGLLYEEGERVSLDKAAEQKRQKFRALVSKKQAELLPAMRDAYGPLMRNHLWEANGSARTIGAGYRTVEFVSSAFASNANIKKINDQMNDMLMMLRFSRSQYKWYREADEYTYYDLKSPKDTEIVKWQGGGYRVLK